MNEYAELGWNGHKTRLRLIEGTAGERAIDVSKLREETGLITLDDGYGNTGSCQSAITFIDGEKGILRYRGIPIEELAEQSTFKEAAYLLIYGKLPTRAELREFSNLLTAHQLIHEDMKFHFEGFPPNAHPMAILSSMINAAGCYYPAAACAPGVGGLCRQSCFYSVSGSHHRRFRLP
jgi:citrate synthase